MFFFPNRYDPVVGSRFIKGFQGGKPIRAPALAPAPVFQVADSAPDRTDHEISTRSTKSPLDLLSETSEYGPGPALAARAVVPPPRGPWGVARGSVLFLIYFAGFFSVPANGTPLRS